MSSEKLKIVDRDQWWSYRYKTSIISFEKTGDVDYPEYLEIVFTLTKPDNQNKGFFKENAKLILNKIKEEGYKGLIIKNYGKLSIPAKRSIQSGVESGWIIKEVPQSIYKIEEIN